MSFPQQIPHLGSAFHHTRFVARRKLISFLDLKFYFEDEAGNGFGFVKRKALKLREDIRVFTDESMTTELLAITARSILDFSSAYDVVESASNQKVGALKRSGWKSLMRDEWIIMDGNDVEIGRIREDSAVLALLRRFVTNLIPQSYDFEVAGAPVGCAKQNFNIFAPKMNVDFTADVSQALDPRMRIASIALLLSIEGRQSE